MVQGQGLSPLFADVAIVSFMQIKKQHNTLHRRRHQCIAPLRCYAPSYAATLRSRGAGRLRLRLQLPARLQLPEHLKSPLGTSGRRSWPGLPWWTQPGVGRGPSPGARPVTLAAVAQAPGCVRRRLAIHRGASLDIFGDLRAPMPDAAQPREVAGSTFETPPTRSPAHLAPLHPPVFVFIVPAPVQHNARHRDRHRGQRRDPGQPRLG